MLESFMHKFYTIFLLLFFSPLLIIAKEPFYAEVVNLIANDMQEFSYGNIQFICKPYGVITIDEIYRDVNSEPFCRESIRKFYAKHADLKYFTNSKMKIYQLYSLDIKKDSRCTVNIAGKKTLSEVLIEQGLAVKKPLLDDREYENYFFAAEKKAKDNKKGLWSSNIAKDCAKHLYTVE
jgi:hypothetical protein